MEKMTPADHYRRTEALLDQPSMTHTLDGRELSWQQAHDQHMALLARAQVHATLASIREDPYS